MLQAGLDSGLLKSVAQVATAAGALLLILMLIGLGGFAYKSLRGDGIRWPDEEDEEETGVTRAGDDEEWKYS